MAFPDYGSIVIRGARENNLKSVSLDIPKRRITVFTGVSGSGKSSLVFSTIAWCPRCPRLGCHNLTLPPCRELPAISA